MSNTVKTWEMIVEAHKRTIKEFEVKLDRAKVDFTEACYRLEFHKEAAKKENK